MHQTPLFYRPWMAGWDMSGRTPCVCHEQKSALEKKSFPPLSKRFPTSRILPVFMGIQQRLDENPQKMRLRRETVEHPFGTIKSWMGYTHFQMKTLKRVGTEMALHVLAYNLKRVINIIGIRPLIAAMRAA